MLGSWILLQISFDLFDRSVESITFDPDHHGVNHSIEGC